MDNLWITSYSLVQLALSVGAGILGGLAANLQLRRIIRSLSYSVADLEERVVREVKKRAMQKRWGDQETDAAILEAAASSPADSKSSIGSLSWPEWWKSKMVSPK